MLLMSTENGKITANVNSSLTVSQHALSRSNYWRMDPLKKIVARIEDRLAKTGQTAAAASKKAGLSSSAIYNLQRGARGKIPTKGGNASTFAALAPVLKTTSTYLTEGIGPAEVSEHIDSEHILPAEQRASGPRKVRVVGYVGAGSVAHYYALADDDYEEVDAPDGATEQTVAVEIRGKSFGPLLDSWLVYYDDVRSPVTEDLFNQVCVVGLNDDRILIKKIRRERDGSYTLLSNSNEPPIKNAEIEWAALVTDMKPRR